MGLLINIDTGGTLTDFCVVDGARVLRTKALTTAYDLSKCLFDGLRKTSVVLYGAEDLQRLLLATDYIRYSTTHGTNALVERKGPRLGLLLLGGLSRKLLTGTPAAEELYRALVGDRSQTIDLACDEAELDAKATASLNRLAAAGATRVVVSGMEVSYAHDEQRVKRLLLRRFPSHLLGALPVLYAHELVTDDDPSRRTWTAMFNAFLHPAMERFLYSAERRLRESKTQKPLLVFRNDGGASRVARTTAIKTYSSGPRAGAEAVRALAVHYGFGKVVGMDVGGTTTDIVLVRDGSVRTVRYGAIEGIDSSVPLCDVRSIGVGGSSVVRVGDNQISIGPDSVGSTPGPACFGLGGAQLTLTDVALVTGLLDPKSYFGGELPLDLGLARQALEQNAALPLGVSVIEAAMRIERAWVDRVAAAVREATPSTDDTVLAAFGGAGPLLATAIAEAAGIGKVLMPGLAPVLSAFGVGFSDIYHSFEVVIPEVDATSIGAARTLLTNRAERSMFAEGAEFKECRLEFSLAIGERSFVLEDAQPPEGVPDAGPAALSLRVTKEMPRVPLTGRFGVERPPAKPADARRVLVDSKWVEMPLVRLGTEAVSCRGEGPVVLEDAFFTARIDRGWRFEYDTSGDILLTNDMERRS